MEDAQSLDESLVLGLAVMEADRQRAEPIVRQLISGERAWGDLGPEERRLVGGLPLLEVTFARSWSLRYDDPAEMVALAESGCALAERLDEGRYGAKISADLRARSWADLGNAYRVADRLEEAGRAFGNAMAWVTKGTSSARQVAFIAEEAATLLKDLRRLEEAMALLEEVAETYRRLGDGEALARVLVHLGIARGDANEPERAIFVFWEALKLIGWDSELLLSAVHGMLWHLVEIGLCDLAHELLEEHRRVYRHSGKLIIYRLHWLEGRIAAGRGNLRKAEAQFNVARLGFAGVDKSYDVALVGLDLALVYVQQERRSELLWLLNDMIATFKVHGIARETIASLTLVRRSCEKRSPREVLVTEIRTIARVVGELQHSRT